MYNSSSVATQQSFGKMSAMITCGQLGYGIKPKFVHNKWVHHCSKTGDFIINFTAPLILNGYKERYDKINNNIHWKICKY